jgi:hypothetical protein
MILLLLPEYKRELTVCAGPFLELTDVKVSTSDGMLVMSCGLDAIWKMEAKTPIIALQCRTLRRSVIVINVTFRLGIFMLILIASFFSSSFADSRVVPRCSLLE